MADAAPPPAGVNPNVASWYAHATKPRRPAASACSRTKPPAWSAICRPRAARGCRRGLTGDNRTAWGTAQWRGPRLANLRSYAAAKGLDPQSMEAQQAFMHHEMIGDPDVPGSGRGSEAGAYQNLLAAKDPAGAATAFNRTYERSADRSGRREAGAGRVAGLFGGAPHRSARSDCGRDDAAGWTDDATGHPARSHPQRCRRHAEGADRRLFLPATASNRTGDVQSDVAPQGIRPTGGLGGDSPVAASVGDTVQARGDAIKGPTPITPEPNPPPQVGQIQTADATAPRPPGVTADATTTAPVVPPLGPKPAPPQLMPTENPRTQHYEAIAADQRLSPATRENAKSLAAVERAQINTFNAQKIQEYNAYLKPWIDAEQKLKDPASIYAVERARRDLEGEGFAPVSPEQAKSLMPMGGQLPAGQTVWQNRRGELKFGPTPPATTIIDATQKGETAEAKLSGELAAKRADATIQAGEAADETKFNIARARAMLDQIKTGAFQDGKTSIAAIGRGLGVSDDFLVSIGLDPKGIGTKQAFQAVVNELAMGKIGAGGMPSNNFSEGDRKFLEKTVISLGDDDEANRIKLAAADLVADRKREKATAWGDWQDNPENKGGYGAFERKWNKDMRTRNDSAQLQKDADAWLAKARGQLPSAPAEFSSQEKADAIKFIGENPNSPKIPAIKQRYGLP